MKRNIKLLATLVCVSTLAMAGFTATAAGTDILHFTVIKAMTNEGVETNATGLVEALHMQQGKAHHQKLRVFANGLTPDEKYVLLALKGDDTNWINTLQFRTDTNGSARVRYDFHAKAKFSDLPASLKPLSSVRELAIANVTSNENGVVATVILSADLTDPDKLKYQIKRDLSTNGVRADLRIHATTNSTQFSLRTSGLASNADYLLVFNGSIVQTNTTNSKGRMTIKSAPTPEQILDLRSVQLWDTSSNVVVSTTLP